ncbi:MAG: S8 family serine peptidase [Candidatus Pacebacteria bacterium]|nr:S8 family serine peptidase [Candidatus Paceibacterota bacterium]
MVQFKKIISPLLAFSIIICVSLIFCAVYFVKYNQISKENFIASMLGSAQQTKSANNKFIIGYFEPPTNLDETDIKNKGGKIKDHFKIIPAIAVELSAVAVEELKKSPKVKYVEPDFVVNGDVIPNDSSYSSLWGMTKILAPTAWDVSTGSDDVVVAVIDSGINYQHSDLVNNMWVNPGEIAGNGIDDDKNGYIDDIYGYDFVNNDALPMDDNSHGTHVAGTIGAVGNNGVGVAGVNWRVKIMALKFLDSTAYGYTSNAIRAMQYMINMKQKGIPVIVSNNSWGGMSYSTSLENAIRAVNDAGILFVASAGNSSANNDITAHYPSGFDVPNIIAVASTDSADNKSSFSNYGSVTVDLGAPGSSIYSTMPSGYGTKSGTSMAAPHVTGVVALIKSQFPTLNHLEIKNRILQSVDVLTSLAGKVLSNGRLNVYNALTANIEPAFPPVADFIGVPTNGEKPLTVVFSDQSSGQIDSWLWEFGDGATSTQEDPSYVYSNPGSYNVKLTVNGQGGTDTQSKIGYISVTSPLLMMQASSISFSSKIVRNKLTLYTDIKVVDENLNPISGATIKIALSLTGGRASTISGISGANGIARLALNKASAGTYTAIILSITSTNYKWDDTKGINSKSCELKKDGTIIQ